MALTTLAALACALAGNLVGSVWSAHQRQLADLATQAELVGRMTSPALTFEDPALAEANLALFDTRPNVRAAAIYDQQGRLFATYEAAGQPSVPFPRSPGSEGSISDGSEVVTYKRIRQGGDLLGTVYLRAGSVVGGMVERGVAIAGIAGLCALVIVAFLIRSLARVVTQPLATVAGVAREVVSQRDYSRRVIRPEKDEVSELVDAFNNMLVEVERRTAQLQSSYAEIQREAEDRRLAQEEVQRLNADLEERVGQRTLALQESNRELALAMAAADEANRAKSNFLATMSHEIRTPMNGVIGMVDVLHQSQLSPDQSEMVELIRESALSLLNIIEDTLDFSKIEAGRMDLEVAPMSLAAVLEGASAMLDQLAMRKGVELTVFVDPAIPDRVKGDALRLRQVLINLVSNGIKFSSGLQRAGRVALRATLVEADAGRVKVKLDVRDNGVGIDAEAGKRLFSAFSQADSSTTRRFGGTGLGLVISRRLIELMGGDLDFESEPGRGATFTVRLSLGLEGEAGAAASGNRSQGPHEQDPLNCLVIGDAGGLAPDIASYLEDDGVRVVRASDLAQAREAMTDLPQGGWIWIVDAGSQPLHADDVRRFAPGLPGTTIAFLLVGRGASRAPQRIGDDMVAIDGNVLARERLCRAVALAAGRETGDDTPAATHAPPLQAQAPSREDAVRQRRLILVAEDNETNQKVILRQLALLGHAADVADNGRQALEYWSSGDYSLLLTDLHMPEMDGHELTTAIRAAEHGAHRAPILGFTANALKGEAERCRASGMDACLVKPVQLRDLATALDTWLSPVAKQGPTPGAPPSGTTLPIDVTVLEVFVGSDPEIINTVLLDFRATAEDIVHSMEEAWSRADVPQLGRLAHKLKSSSQTVGALALSELCVRLEAAAKTDDRSALASLRPLFGQEAGAVIAFLNGREGGCG